MWRTVYTNDGAVWQALALTVACQEKILGAAAHFKSDFNIVAHHNGAYRQAVWGNWGYAEITHTLYAQNKAVATALKTLLPPPYS